MRSKTGRSVSHEDHANARLLAEALAHTEGVVIDLATVETNIVIFRLAAGKGAAELSARLKSRGVLVGAFGPDAVRVVTHRDVSRKDCIDAAQALTEEIESGVTVILSDRARSAKEPKDLLLTTARDRMLLHLYTSVIAQVFRCVDVDRIQSA